MRITGGKAARRILKTPKGLEVRPTPDLVKQAVFNSLGARVVGARVLELFAGTGALSLECLSRGATSALCIEKSHKHVGIHPAKMRNGECRMQICRCEYWTFSPRSRNSRKPDGNLI